MSVSASALELAWAHCHNGMYFKTLLWYTKFNTIPAQNHKPSNAIFMYRYVPKNVHIEDIKWNIIQLGNAFTLVRTINISRSNLIIIIDEILHELSKCRLFILSEWSKYFWNAPFHVLNLNRWFLIWGI